MTCSVKLKPLTSDRGLALQTERNQGAHSPLRFAAVYGTNPGLKRTLNEDSCLAQFPVFVVADGMGGHQGGEVASAMAVGALRTFVGRTDVTVQEARKTLAAAQAEISAFADTLPDGAGTTLTGVIAVRGPDQAMEWLLLNIGDSRTYRRLGTEFVRLTRDHSLVQDMIDAGELTEEQALVDTARNVITRALGDGESVPDLWISPIVPGERIIVISDGAAEGVTDFELGQATAGSDRQEAVQKVVDLALARGGSDNITVIVLDVIGDRFAPNPPLPPLRPLSDRTELDFDQDVPDDTTSPALRRNSR